MKFTKGSTVSGQKAKRTVAITAGTGKLRGRSCIRVDLNPAIDKLPKKPRGTSAKVKPSATQFRGCFTSAAEAKKVAQKLATMPTLPKGKGRKAKKSRKKSKK